MGINSTFDTYGGIGYVQDSVVRSQSGYGIGRNGYVCIERCLNDPPKMVHRSTMKIFRGSLLQLPLKRYYIECFKCAWKMKRGSIYIMEWLQ